MRLTIFGFTLMALTTNSPSAEAASPWYAAAGVGYGKSDLSSWSGSHDGPYGLIKIGYHLNSLFGLEVGGLMFETFSTSGEDPTGQYRLTFEKHDLYFGPTLRYEPQRFLPIQATLGITRSRFSMTVKESFWDLAPQGSAKSSDSVTGVYFSIGMTTFEKNQISSRVMLDYVKRPDIFSSSPRSFDSKERGISLQLLWQP